jgi:hypothetical protein
MAGERTLRERLEELIWGTRKELENGPLGTVGSVAQALYSPRGPLEDIRHKWEQAAYGQQVTPWSHDPVKPGERDIYGRETSHDPYAVSDAAWNRMEPASRADLYGRDPQTPEQPDPYSPGIDR